MLILSFVVFNGCIDSGDKTESELEILKEKIKVLEEKLQEKEGLWVWVPEDFFQPSIKSILNDLSKLDYTPQTSPANDLINIAKEHMKENAYQDAFDKFQDASELDENNPEPYYWLGVLLPAIGGPINLAILWLEDAIEKDQSQQQIIAMLAYGQRGIFELWDKWDNPEPSIDNLTECIRLGIDKEEVIPTFFQGIYTNRGVAYQLLGDIYKALDDYNRALDLAVIEPNPPVIMKIEEIVAGIERSIEIQNSTTPSFINVLIKPTGLVYYTPDNQYFSLISNGKVRIDIKKDSEETEIFYRNTTEKGVFGEIETDIELYQKQSIECIAILQDEVNNYLFSNGYAILSWEEVNKSKDFGDIYIWEPKLFIEGTLIKLN